MTEIFRRLRIFVASPGDVQEERDRLARVVEELRTGIAAHHGFDLELVRWETHVRPGMGEDAQEVVSRQVGSYDLFIGIMWKRFGTPTKRAESGTEEEFNQAYQQWQTGQLHDILFYFCQRPYTPRTLDEIQQWGKVLEFRKRLGALGLIREYTTRDQFEDLVRQHLTQVILEMAGKEALKAPRPRPKPRILSNLPRRPPIFVGRKEEIANCLEALNPEERGWGVVVDGIAGIGKTALALEVAHTCLKESRFDAYIWVSAKTSVLTPQGIRQETMAATSLDAFLDEIARLLGEPGIPKIVKAAEKQRTVLDGLQSRKALLVLDNLETLIAEEREALSAFLRRLPSDCKAIVTSRRRTGEQALIIRLDKLSLDEACQLMDELGRRYPRVAGQLARGSETGRRELYELTGGSPLAIHWALGLMAQKDYTFRQALATLQDAGRAPDLYIFLFQESTQDLSPAARAVLSSLAYFHTPVAPLDLADLADLPRPQVQTALDDLVALSLANQLGEDEPRYGLHPLTRTYVRAALGETTPGEMVAASLAGVELDAEAGRKVARYWLGYAERYGGSGKDAYKTFDKLEAAWPDLEATARWLAERAGVLTETPLSPALWEEAEGESLAQTAAQMVIYLERALSQFLRFRGYWDERIHLGTWRYRAGRLLGRWLDAGWGAHGVAWMHDSRGDTDEAAAWADRCAEAWERGGGRYELAVITRLRGLIAEERGDLDEAERLLNRALAEYRDLKSEAEVAIVLNDLGALYRKREDYDDAEVAYREALAIDEKRGDLEGQATDLGNLADLALYRNRWEQAKELAERALELGREVGRQDSIAADLWYLARALEELGRSEDALPLAEEALVILERLRDKDVGQARELVDRLRGKIGQGMRSQ